MEDAHGISQQRRRAIIRLTDKLLEDSLHSARGFQVAGDRWLGRSRVIGIGATMGSAALAGTAGIVALVGESSGWAATLAFFAAALSAVRAYLQPEELASSFSIKGNRILSIRNRADIFREVEVPFSSDLNHLAEGIKALRKDYDDLLLEPPHQIPRWAYNAARKSIAAGESNYGESDVWREE